MRHVLLGALGLLTACGGGGSKSLELTLTLPDGTVQRQTLVDDTGFQFDGQERATASFPDIAEWGVKVPLGVSVRLFALQPGRYGTGGSLHLGADSVAKSEPLTLDVTVERVRWQNSGAHPFRLEGTLSGTSAKNHKLEGRFSTTTHDCSDKVTANAGSFLCGTPFPSKSYKEQVWTVESWDSVGDCPDAVFKRFAGGRELSLAARFASAGGQKQLQCVGTYANEYKVICGASEEGFEADGCTWSIAAFATPGVVSVNQPRMAIVAGTIGSCAPKLCTLTPRGLVHKSGASSLD